MTDETLKMVQEMQRKNLEDFDQTDYILDLDDVQQKKLTMTKELQKLEHDERELRLKESEHELEVEKFKYQQEQDARNAENQRNRAVIENIAPILGQGISAVWNFGIVPNVFNWGMKYEQTNSISSKTFRGFYSEMLRPKLIK